MREVVEEHIDYCFQLKRVPFVQEGRRVQVRRHVLRVQRGGLKLPWIQPFVVVVKPRVRWRKIFGSGVQLILMRCGWLRVVREGWIIPFGEQLGYASDLLLLHSDSWPPFLRRSARFLHLIWRRLERHLHGPIDRVHNWLPPLLRSIGRYRRLR